LKVTFFDKENKHIMMANISGMGWDWW